MSDRVTVDFSDPGDRGDIVISNAARDAGVTA